MHTLIPAPSSPETGVSGMQCRSQKARAFYLDQDLEGAGLNGINSLVVMGHVSHVCHHEVHTCRHQLLCMPRQRLLLTDLAGPASPLPLFTCLCFLQFLTRWPFLDPLLASLLTQEITSPSIRRLTARSGTGCQNRVVVFFQAIFFQGPTCKQIGTAGGVRYKDHTTMLGQSVTFL